MNPLPTKIENSNNKGSIADKSLEDDTPQANETNKSLYENKYQKDRALKMVDTMKKRDLFCDVTLKVEGGPDIRAHRNILAAYSPYFYEAFTNIDEHEQQRIKIQDIQHSALEQLIDYIYTSKIYIAEDNVQALHHAARFLQLTDVCDACYKFMKTQLKPFHYLETLEFAENNGYRELLTCTKEYIEENFGEIVKHDEFLALSPERILQLISSDNLSGSLEETIFESIMSWVNFDLENRKKYLAGLMEHVRMPLLSRKYLIDRVEKEPLFKTNLQCQQFLIEALKYHLLDDKEKTLSQTSRTKPRQLNNQSRVLLVIGSWFQSAKDLFDECYDFENKKWYQSSELHSGTYGTELAVVEGRVYRIRDSETNNIDVYDPSTKKWSKCGDMLICREALGVAVLDNCIYVLGGGNDEESMNSVESYDPRKNEWQMIPSMLKRRDMLGVGVVNGFLYAIGGYDWKSEKYLSSAERYDPQKKKWESIANMSKPRRDVRIGVIDDILYAVGGFDGKSSLRSVEAYDPKTNEWKFVAEMSKCRSGAGVVVYNGMLYVVGGSDETSHLTSVEVFSPATNSWSTLHSSMNRGSYYIGVPIIDKLRAPEAVTGN